MTLIEFCDKNNKEVVSTNIQNKKNDINLLFFNSTGSSLKNNNDQPNFFNFMSSDNISKTVIQQKNTSNFNFINETPKPIDKLQELKNNINSIYSNNSIPHQQSAYIPKQPLQQMNYYNQQMHMPNQYNNIQINQCPINQNNLTTMQQITQSKPDPFQNLFSFK
jgi:hypothetical protein